jgi:hypothetical protein
MYILSFNYVNVRYKKSHYHQYTVCLCKYIQNAVDYPNIMRPSYKAIKNIKFTIR